MATMKVSRRILPFVVAVLLFALAMICQSEDPAVTAPVVTSSSGTDLAVITLPAALTNGRPTLAEFGRGTCIPCKEMKPILENLAIEYQDRLNVSIVSVDDYRELTNYYHIMAIPTQIGFDGNGKEIFRHVGLWPREQIVAQLGKLGIR